MHSPPFESLVHHPIDPVFSGGSELARLCRGKDWAATPLGPVESWPESLRAAVRLCLGSSIGMSVCAGSEHALIYNDAYSPFLGADRHPWALGRTAREVWRGCWEWLGPELERVTQRGESLHREDQRVVLTREGSEQEAFFTYSRTPIREADGRIVGVLNVVHERTEQVRRVAESEAHYRMLLESIDQGFCLMELMFDEHGQGVDYRFLETNSTFERHTGLSDAAGRTAYELVPNLERRWPELYGRVAMTGEAVRVTQHSAVMGRWFQLEAFRVGAPEQRRVGLLFTDITERKRDEEALRREADANAYRTGLTDALRPLSDPAAIQAEAASVLGRHLRVSRVHYATVSADGQFADVAADYVDGVASVVGCHRFVDFGHILMNEARAGRILAVTDVAADPRLSPAERERAAALEAGAYVVVPLIKEARPVAVFVVHHAEPRAWSEAEVALIEETAERTWAAVERARSELELRETDRRKDEFLAMLAHELRNPLAAIHNTVQLLGRVVDERKPQRWVEILQRQTATLGGLVDDLLDVSRITRGLIELKVARVDLVLVVERALESVQPLVDAQQHDVSVTLPDKPVPVMGDALRLEQILVNLLTNAAKYTDAGGRISVGVERRGDAVELWVRDSGIGLEPGSAARIFDLFGQAERGLDRSQGGLGIGLTIVKNLVELHEGRIEARSPGLGQGAEFIVTLPAAVEERPPVPAPALPANRNAAKRVLVVDDNVDIAQTLAMLLEESGHAVTLAHDGPSALAKAEALAPELILLDIGLPGMDGYAVAERLRQNPVTRNAVLAALTGYGQADDVERARAAGFDRHFIKPVDIDVLEAFVNGAVAKSRGSQSSS